MEADSRSTCSTMSAESCDLSNIKTEVILRFDRQKKHRGTHAKCPRCSYIGANLWECERCHFEYGRTVELISEANLPATFRPKIIKTERAEVPDNETEEDAGSMMTQPVIPAPKIRESATSAMHESSNTGVAAKCGISSDTTPAFEKQKPLNPLAPVKTNQIETEAEEVSSSSSMISTTTSELPEVTSSSHRKPASVERRESTTSNCSSSSYKSRHDKPQRSSRSQKVCNSGVDIEKRIRIFQRVSKKSLERSVLNSAPMFSNNRCRLDAQVNIEDVVIEETRMNEKPKIIRLLRVPSRGLGLDAILNSDEYPEEVEKLIFGTPSSMHLVQQALLFFKAITAIRFGQNSLNISDDDKQGRLDRNKLKNKRITSFELTFDRKHYNELSRVDKEIVTHKIVEVLKLAQECFIKLEECTITIPHTSEMNRVLDKLVARLPRHGEKIIKYGQDTIQYSLHKADKDPGPNNENKASHLAKSDCGQNGSCESFADLRINSNMSQSQGVRPSSNSTATSSDVGALDMQFKTEIRATNSSSSQSPIDTIDISSDEDYIGQESTKSNLLNVTIASSSQKRDREEDDDRLLMWNNNSTNIPDYAVPCRKCGAMSMDIYQCDKCHSVIDMKAPIRQIKRQKLDETTTRRSTVATTSSPVSALITCKSIGIGDYIVSLENTEASNNKLSISPDSMSFKVPHRRTKALIKCEIKFNSILTVVIHDKTAKLPLIAVRTTESFEDKIRVNLGLNENKGEQGDFYSYDKGGHCQKLIIIRPEAIAPQAVRRINECLGDKVSWIPYERAIDMIEKAECKCRK